MKKALSFILLLLCVGCSNTSMIDEARQKESTEEANDRNEQESCKEFLRRVKRFYGFDPFGAVGIADDGSTAIMRISLLENKRVDRCYFDSIIASSDKIFKMGDVIYSEGECAGREHKKNGAYQFKEEEQYLYVYSKHLQEPLCLFYGEASEYSKLTPIKKEDWPVL